MFVNKIGPIIYNEVANIGGRGIITKEIGTVMWSWTGDWGKIHTKKINNVLYFPESLVNILSATSLTESMKDDEVISIQTKRKYSIFTWYFGKCKKTITHSEIVFHN